MQIECNQQLGILAQFLPITSQTYGRRFESSTSVQSTAYSVLILDGNSSFARLLATGLSSESLTVDVSHDIESALQQIESHAYHLFILDLDIQGSDGLPLLGRLRFIRPAMRLLVLSGRTGIDAAVDALNQGADDYLLKPFSLLEMMARVRVLRRRSSETTQAATSSIQKLVLDRDQCRVERDGRTVDLTPREFDLLEFMMQHSGKTLSRATLTQKVWNMPVEGNTNIVDVYVKYLRDKLDSAYDAKLIRTVRGIGYVFQEHA